MAFDSTKVRVPGSGEMLIGLTSATAPTGTGGTTTGFTGLGYITEDSLEMEVSKESEDITALGGVVVRTVTKSGKVVFKLALMETTKGVVEQYFQTTVTQTVTEGSFNISPTASKGRQSFILDIVDGSELTRWYVAQGEVTGRSAISYKTAEPVVWEIEVTAYDVAGVSAKGFMTALKTP